LEDVIITSSDADERAGDPERRHEPSGRLFERVSQEVGREPAKAWWNLSEETHRAAVKGDPTRSLPKLHKGDCIKSTNREAVILPSGCGAVILELFRRVLGGR
jgi:hypothetical protein